MCLGIPGQLVEIIDRKEQRGVVDVDGVRREINIGLVTGEEVNVDVGDWVLVHVGFAMSKIDEQEAAETLSFMKGLGSVYDDEIDQFSQALPLYADDGGATEAGTNGNGNGILAQPSPLEEVR